MSVLRRHEVQKLHCAPVIVHLARPALMPVMADYFVGIA